MTYSFDFGFSEIFIFGSQIVFTKLFFVVLAEFKNFKSLVTWFEVIFLFFILIACLFIEPIFIYNMKINLSNIIAWILGFIFQVLFRKVKNPTIFGKKLW